MRSTFQSIPGGSGKARHSAGGDAERNQVRCAGGVVVKMKRGKETLGNGMTRWCPAVEESSWDRNAEHMRRI